MDPALVVVWAVYYFCHEGARSHGCWAGVPAPPGFSGLYHPVARLMNSSQDSWTPTGAQGDIFTLLFRGE